jgi:methionyl-tRNA formyltransferase
MENKTKNEAGRPETGGGKREKIVFMGTPAFAVESLRALVEGGYPVAGVVTMPDKPVGKHHSSLQASPVKEYALSQNLPLLQPESLKDPGFLTELAAWEAALQIVVAFRMLPEVVWKMPPLGTFNLHASLLPQYRGAAPINWAIINGEKETGLTTFFLDREIDTGRIIARERVSISENDTAGTLHDRLMHLGARLVIQTVDAINANNVRSLPQEKWIRNEENLKAAPKIFKDTCLIDWNKTTREVYDFIRGLSPYPAARTELPDGKGERLNLKIFEAGKKIEPHSLPPGTVVSDGKTFLNISAKDGFIVLKSIRQAGKKQMGVDEFLRGNRLS